MNSYTLCQLVKQIAIHIPSLNIWQRKNLAAFTLAAIAVQSSQMMQIAAVVAVNVQVESVYKQLQRFLGGKWDDRQALSALAAWVLGAFKVEGDSLYLLVDETKLGKRMNVMMLSLAYECRALHLAWCCYQNGNRPPEGQVGVIVGLLKLIKPHLPFRKRIVVLADRGIGKSTDLCKAVTALGFTYGFRLTLDCVLVAADGTEYKLGKQLKPGEVWQMSGRAFTKINGRKVAGIKAHVRAIWDPKFKESCIVLSNSADFEVLEYGHRVWQEQSFRDLKSNGFNWQVSMIRCPERMSRLLLILSLAYALVLNAGIAAVECGAAGKLIRDGKTGKLRRHLSLFKEGMKYFVRHVMRQGIFLDFCFVADKRLAEIR